MAPDANEVQHRLNVQPCMVSNQSRTTSGPVPPMRKPVFWIVLIIALAAAVGQYLWRLQAQQQERLEPLPVHTAEAPGAAAGCKHPVDNLPRNKVDTRALPVNHPDGQTLTSGEGDVIALGPSNYARYRSYVKLAHAAAASWSPKPLNRANTLLVAVFAAGRNAS